MAQDRKTPEQQAGPRAVAGLRPLTARSVVASTLLGVSPPRLPARLLVRSGELFGIAEGTTRTAISRMLAAGELEPDPDAAQATYRLAGPLLARWARQAESRDPGSEVRWDGGWLEAVVSAERRPASERTALRQAMATLHLAELREGVWVRPDNLAGDRHPEATAVVDQQCRWFELRPADDPAALAAELWDLDGWAARAGALAEELDRHRAELVETPPEHLAEGFLLSAASLRHLLADPLLPGRLLPADWPGEALRAAHRRYDAAFTVLWRERFSDERGAG